MEKSVSGIVGVLTPTQSNLVYLAYGVAIVALPFMILVGLIVARQWKLLGAYAAAGFFAVLALSITGNGIAARAGTSTSPNGFRPPCRSSSTTRAGSPCWPGC